MKIAIIQFPGNNCESESIRAVRNAQMNAEEFLWNQDYQKLKNYDGYFIVGGFSYEDRSRAGIIASLDPIMKIITDESKKGKPVLGVCNGAQILVESGLVPGLKNNEVGMALDSNKQIQNERIVGVGFYNNWVNIKLDIPSKRSAFSRHMAQGDFIRLPIAHGEGRFVIPERLLEEMKLNHMTIFRYCDNEGKTESQFPTNPNGTVYNLAAVINKNGNIMAMMPHPERTPMGQPIFTSMREYIEKEKSINLTPLTYTPNQYKLNKYKPKENSKEIITKLIITDNVVSTVQNTLRQTGINANIERYTHWEINFDDNINKDEIYKQITETGELYNSNKEYVIENFNAIGTKQICLLVNNNDDIIGEYKKETLDHRLNIKGIKNINKGTLWKISVENDSIDTQLQQILKTHILFNQYSQNCYIYNKHMDYTDKIKNQLNKCITQTTFNAGKKRIGKVRDSYEFDDKMILITTDRQSAFDKVLAAIPFKGQVLNQTSAWWFKKTAHIIPNHVLQIPKPNVTIAKKCTVFPVEFVVRGYITGTTDTSAWINYEKGVRNFCGNLLPDGLVKNQKFFTPIVTPTTKDDNHDSSITPKEIVEKGLMTQAEWDYVSKKSLELFAFGQKISAEHGLILVDTKYEFGKDKDGNILLIDEIHTPDSSRYWIAESYAERFAKGQEPENIDKEFLRIWFKNNCDPYNDAELPKAPEELVIELSKRYIKLYEMITGEKFQFPEDKLVENTAIKTEVKNEEKPIEKLQYLQPTGTTKIKAVLILGSTKDEDHAQKITQALSEQSITYVQHVASAHKEATKLLELLEKYQDEKVVYITIAGRSNALSGFMAGNSNKPVIACPPFKDKMDMLVNIHSTLQMPSHVPVMTILEPGNVALAIKRIIDLA
ncbi:MAG: hypothetical protein A2725_03790 [Candidatus Magasanikbacteria bacterium RIFCSPHIGHO2_01_FULL_33_34]|uniref:Phosphoribosylaminoimidazole-succinocarboxamide synthase n=1 Tax=Candidatus Magasanikbacteria bacterium RIFCSPHIGHO2_01_FULL_33_34 TaxID=1798671 RepID=A0A1F6LHR9_9BACT|nr:MAG: hypothetical protein A2725_03790 [Candidatus Magasanikbacteria bacterium RIFCSPHIGHO2_01_FULL_33_34]OGH65093.1 MAG: hypothetical protein A3B83_03550 [Candidatus Magasanikbacteria bacterium RIFCSPHIGHO2_02_FULL_33_17]OGH75363.1 MAG: hypothetical protein A3A89_04615 [Candidatus Magasanikbacteria bacterium RIFCSPLOWO2_01_FULL_33_34]OGH81731.1 MAG: hypothetical protein A3F93_02295 [Candidatus Magasanikbacteria bacterium RIFCSPLOWO2_12_FULL_34_7]